MFVLVGRAQDPDTISSVISCTEAAHNTLDEYYTGGGHLGMHVAQERPALALHVGKSLLESPRTRKDQRRTMWRVGDWAIVVKDDNGVIEQWWKYYVVDADRNKAGTMPVRIGVV